MKDHPRDYAINAYAKAAMEAARRDAPDDPLAACLWELEWCWEEIAQLTCALRMTRELLDKHWRVTDTIDGTTPRAARTPMNNQTSRG